MKNNLEESEEIFCNIITDDEWEISPYFTVILMLVHIYSDFIKPQTLVELGWNESIAEMVIEKVENYVK